MHLEKILQSQGFGSRKQCRQLIEDGKVTINGEVCRNPKASFETQHSDEQPLEFAVAGKSWQYREKVYLALNKPQGYECSHQPQHHPSVFSLLPAQFIERGVQCVGRLDQDTTGLLILTDDGAFLQALTHPKKHVAKRYLVTTNRPIADEQIEQLKQGVALRNEQGVYAADDCLQLAENQLVLTIHQGLYHQVKRMIAAVGNHVDALHREQIGQFKLPDDLAEGEWIYLNDEQVTLARQLA
ncbi:16S rRNA pseudouridine(516) synthase [Alkanindiges hydrocarboniclasticus]|uniref:Pseudouridine synthase n=1 Tax=Alkanindiges hydrocarboniclasticus TaxID=1907941 RepID=A0A1S8CU12_9GAMM|nr:16S rRNA pseudouridine(516) synthase [Alkanindiges hydrocarboniclasticus]ONG38983.1 16S rRNA pseudouridine(516) synthase [Alkanindiges hydrocarboniclasticus]